MYNHIKIVGLGGSLTNHSHSLYALEICAKSIQTTGASIQIFDAAALNLPMYDTRNKNIPQTAQAFCQAIYEADALIWSSPLYHGTVSGLFKNTIDWLELLSKYTPKYLTNKPVALIATAGGIQGLQAINTMEFIVRALRGFTLPMVVPISQAWQQFDASGNLKNQKIQEQLETLGLELVKVAHKFAN